MALKKYIRAKLREYGQMQLVVLLVACAGQTIDGMAIVQSVFILPTLKPICLEITIGEQNVLNSTDLDVDDKLYTMNDSSLHKDYCKRLYTDDNCTAVYDRSFVDFSATEQYSLTCDREYLITLSVTLYFVGFLVGSLIGFLSDRFGRRKMAILCNTLNIACGVVASVAPHFIIFLIFRSLTAAMMIGWFIPIWVLIGEICKPESRLLMTILSLGSFGIGQIVLAGVAYFLRNHRYIQMLIAMIMIPIVLAMFFFVPESPRWLLAQGRVDEAFSVYERIAKFNGEPLPEKTNATFKDLQEREETSKNEQSWKQRLRLLMSTWSMVKITLVVLLIWAVNSLVYYGLLFGSADFGGNVFVNVSVGGAMEIAAIIFLFWGLEKLGRRPMISSTLLLSGLCLSVMVVVFHNKETLVLPIAAMLGKFCITTSFNCAYIMTSEIYPTLLRTTSTGVGSLSARIGSMTAPSIGQLSQIWQPLGILVFAVLSIICGLLSLLLPETTGRDLPQTVDDTITLVRETGLVCCSCCRGDKRKEECDQEIPENVALNT